jgi:hypothetical protein
MAESKTARASAVKEKTDKKVISDEELIRNLRIEVDSNIYPSQQGTLALLRAYDSLKLLWTALLAEKGVVLDELNGVKLQLEEANDQIGDLQQSAIDAGVERDLNS